MSSKLFYPFKDFQSDQIQRSSRKIFTAHHARRIADLNLTPVTGTTNGFISQIINLLIEFWGVCLTCLDCNIGLNFIIFVGIVMQDSKVYIKICITKELDALKSFPLALKSKNEAAEETVIIFSLYFRWRCMLE